METQKKDFKPLIKTIYRGLGGTALGIFLVIIFASSGVSEFNSVQVGVASGLILLCGVLSGIWGEKFIDIVMKTLNATSF